MNGVKTGVGGGVGRGVRKGVKGGVGRGVRSGVVGGVTACKNIKKNSRIISEKGNIGSDFFRVFIQYLRS